MALYDKLDTTDEQILAGKRAIAEALLQVGITAVEPNPNNPDSYETFQSYADKVKRLMISNSLILEYSFPADTWDTLTLYKRTVMLPISASSTYVNDLAVQLIESDTGYTPSSATLSTFSTLDDDNAPRTVTDPFGNTVWDGESDPEEPEWSRQYTDYLQTMESQASIPSTMAIKDLYSYTVDWGDGSPVQEFVSMEETPEAWWHTYENPGTYDVTVNGLFKRIYSAAGWSGELVRDGEFVTDRDGVRVQYDENYASQHALKKIIAWGNTQLDSLYLCCCNAVELESIPTYDTTESFSQVTSCSSAFYSNSKLAVIPYDSGAQRGMFSNMPLCQDFARTFQGIAYSGSIPPLLIENCPDVTNISYMFHAARVTGDIPAAMLSGLTSVTVARNVFSRTGISSEIPASLFSSMPNVIRLEQFFYNSAISGIVPAGLFANQYRANILYSFAGECDKLEGVDKDALSGLTADDLNVQLMFNWCTGMTTPIAEGFFAHLTGRDVFAADMFHACSHIPSVPDTFFEETKDYMDCRGMFGHCINIEKHPPLPTFDTYADIEKYLGLFVNCQAMEGYDTLPRELGGLGARLFPDYHVGMFYLDDGTFVEVGDLYYDPDNMPVGFCVLSDDSYDYVAAWNGRNGTMTDSASGYHWPDDPEISPLIANINAVYPQEYLRWEFDKTAEEYTRAFFEWSGFTSNPDVHAGMKWLHDYTAGTREHFWHLPLPKIGCAAMTHYRWMTQACEELRSKSSGTFTASNCYAPVAQIPNILRNSYGGSYLSNTQTTLTQYSQSMLHNSTSLRPFLSVPKA